MCVCVYIYLSIKSDIRMYTFLIRCRPLESSPQCLCVLHNYASGPQTMY
uniref:Uncharacterized protein n=1 Tax=Anguilla anguilla TaxID=7936 RepID=A0A0E9PU26_ANGAN